MQNVEAGFTKPGVEMAQTAALPDEIIMCVSLDGDGTMLIQYKNPKYEIGR